MPGILSRSKNNDGIGRFELLFARCPHNSQTNDDEISQQRSCGNDQPPQPAPVPVACCFCHPWAKNWEMSVAGIAPSRRMRHRASLSVRSTMVEATSRGDV